VRIGMGGACASRLPLRLRIEQLQRRRKRWLA
jgi:hypothetical protein